jgi:hypothetical protein
MAENKPQEPEDVIRDALERVTAALLTVAVATLKAPKQKSGSPADATNAVKDDFDHILNQVLPTL